MLLFTSIRPETHEISFKTIYGIAHFDLSLFAPIELIRKTESWHNVMLDATDGARSFFHDIMRKYIDEVKQNLGE